MTSAFLFSRRALACAPALGWRDFFAGLALALFADLRPPSGFAGRRWDVAVAAVESIVFGLFGLIVFFSCRLLRS